MRNLITGILVGAVIGGVVGTIASDEIYDMKNTLVKKGKKLAKKYDWI